MSKIFCVSWGQQKCGHKIIIIHLIQKVVHTHVFCNFLHKSHYVYRLYEVETPANHNNNEHKTKAILNLVCHFSGSIHIQANKEEKMFLEFWICHVNLIKFSLFQWSFAFMQYRMKWKLYFKFQEMIRSLLSSYISELNSDSLSFKRAFSHFAGNLYDAKEIYKWKENTKCWK